MVKQNTKFPSGRSHKLLSIDEGKSEQLSIRFQSAQSPIPILGPIQFQRTRTLLMWPKKFVEMNAHFVTARM